MVNIENLLDGAMKKSFGNTTLFFRGNYVIAISQGDNYSYVTRMRDENGKVSYMLTTYAPNQAKYLETKIDIDNVVIITDVRAMKGSKCINENAFEAGEARIHPSIVFMIIDYGDLDDFRKKVNPKSKVKVVINNSHGQIFRVPFIVGENAADGKGIHEGYIEGSYRFIPACD